MPLRKICLWLFPVALTGLVYYVPRYVFPLSAKALFSLSKDLGSAAMIVLLFTLASGPVNYLHKTCFFRLSGLKKILYMYHVPTAIFAAGLSLLHLLPYLDTFRFDIRYISGTTAFVIMLLLLLTCLLNKQQQRLHRRLAAVLLVLLLIHAA